MSQLVGIPHDVDRLDQAVFDLERGRLHQSSRPAHEHTRQAVDGSASSRIVQSSSGLSRWVAVYLPTLLPSAVPTLVLLRQCIPPQTRALPSSAWISLMLA
jgi:hypothetical protein